ncbi:DUF3667 domain-containing protein [Maricaulis sp. CAU 1757]
MTQTEHSRPGAPCANCGAALTGPYCSQCGQHERDIRRPAWTLLTDSVGDIFTWDGRFLTTLRAALVDPGRLARRYADGQRARFTPPVRLYLLVSLAFFAAMASFDMRVLAVDILPNEDSVRALDDAEIAYRRSFLIPAEERTEASQADLLARPAPPDLCGAWPGPDEIADDGSLNYPADAGIVVTVFEMGEPPAPRLIDGDTRACLVQEAQDDGLPGFMSDFEYQAAAEPRFLEARAAASAGQALLLTVLILALLNRLLHPRRRLIEQLIAVLYLQVPLLPLIGATLLLANWAPSVALTIAALVTGGLGLLVTLWRADRHFYASSWWGAALRVPVQAFALVVSFSLVAVSLMLLAAL